ncbi:MAG: ribonuclease III [Oscillospiraceae bacterium]|nr:ribonuclease III [Oscillospiraceae bacterium]
METGILEQKLDYTFKDKNLLKKAFTHVSYANEKKCENNEKLEFLGDAILEFVVSKYLYDNHNNLTEGEMTKVRASVVCEASLYDVAKKFNFSDFLYIGKSERAMKGNYRPAVLADSVEAVIAAIFLDSDMEQVEKFIINNLSDIIKDSSKNVGLKDYKTVLQEILQEHGDVSIKYNTIKEQGPDHKKTFTVELLINNKRTSEGQGSNKKQAEMNAAKEAIAQIKKK